MKMLKNQITTLSLLLLILPLIQAQDVDEIISKHLKAHGNIEKWNATENIEIEGLFTAFSEEKEFYAIKTREGEYYSKLHLGQHPVEEAFDGENGWTIDPWHDFTYPRKLNSNEVNVFFQKAEFFTPFYKYKEKGHQAEFLGKQDVDGIPVFAIKLTRSNGGVETWYLDVETYLEYKCESNWVDFTYPGPAESYFDDFREVDGLVLPFFIERTFYQRDRILIIEKVNFNVDFDKSVLDFPRSAEMKKLEFMEGNWDVEVAAWSRRGSWYPMGNTESEISFLTTNRLQEKITYERMFVLDQTIDFTFNSTTKKYRITDYDGFSSEMDVMEGQFTDSTFAASNAGIIFSDTTIEMNYWQRVYSDTGKDGFILEISTSQDKGENWNPWGRFTYTRKIE